MAVARLPAQRRATNSPAKTRAKGGRGADDERPAGPGRHVSVLGEVKRTASGLMPMLALYIAVVAYLVATWVAMQQ